MTLCVPVGLWSKCATRVKLTNLLCVASGTNHIHSWLTASDSRGQLQGSNYSPRTVTVETYKSLRFALFFEKFWKIDYTGVHHKSPLFQNRSWRLMVYTDVLKTLVVKLEKSYKSLL